MPHYRPVPKFPHLYVNEDSGIFYVRLYVQSKSKWISLRTENKAMAKVELRKHLDRVTLARRAKRDLRQGKATMRQLADLYLDRVKLDAKTKPAAKRYRCFTVASLFSEWPDLADRHPARITADDCRRWFADYTTKFSAQLANNVLGSLRAIFALAIEKHQLIEDPSKVLERVRIPKRRLELPTAEQFKQIVEEMRRGRYIEFQGAADLVEFLAYSGCRLGEAIKVKWSDIDRQTNQIYVAAGKNSEPRRIPVIPAMADLLARISAHPRYCYSKSRKGCVLSVSQVYESLTKVCEKVGVPRLTHHDLRHLFATRCIESDVDIPTVSRWLGHRDGGVLAMRIYGHLRDEHSQAQAAKVSF